MQRSLLNCSVMSFVMLFAPFAQVPQSSAQTDENLKLLEESFANPPDASRIMMRWWWFGPSVTKPELQRELEQMKAEGIGGVEMPPSILLHSKIPRPAFTTSHFSQKNTSMRFALPRQRPGNLAYALTSL